MALLAYLAATAPKIHSREQLATLLWPALAEKSARNNLRVTLTRTLNSLGASTEPFILANRQSIQFNSNAPLWTDIAELHALAEALNVDEPDPGNPPSDWNHALHEHFDGNFLAGFNLAGCSEFEHWQSETGEHYRIVATRVYDQLAERQHLAGSLAAAERTTRHVLTLDPLHEPAHKRLIRLLAQQDLRHSAIEHFEYFKGLLDSELGVLPDPGTVSLLAAIEAGVCDPASLA